VKLRLPLPVAAAAALVAASSAAAFTPTNAYYPKQWYLTQDHAFDAWPAPPQMLQPVKVAIVDSGVDCSLPDFLGQIALSRSFVGGSPCIDTEGHGTVVAGEIAGNLDSAGIVGLAYKSQLLVAKVVAPDGTIPLKAEAAGIRWAVDKGARVINLSFGAVRDPLDPALDTYSKVEAQAVAYAVAKGVTVVAAAGNSDEAPATPWEYASWPAALPHVIGVAALTRSGNVPGFSDRDPTYVDIAAPGVDIFSTFPKALTNDQQGCTPQGYTDCAAGDYRRPEGTSFAAPQVSAAAAVLLGIDPRAHEQPGLDDPRAARRRRRCRVRLRRLSGRPRQVQRLGPARCGESGRGSELRGPAARRPVRAERQRLAGARAGGKKAGPDRDARLLGRSPRRLPREARPRAAAPRAGTGAVGRSGGRPEPLERPHGCASPTSRGRRSASRTGRGRPAGTTSSCGSGVPAAAATGCAWPRARSSRGLVLEQLVLGDGSKHARGVADDEHPCFDVLRHDRARPDERLLADLDAREEDCAAADPRSAADGRPLDQLVPALGAAHEVVVRRNDARRDEDLLARASSRR